MTQDTYLSAQGCRRDGPGPQGAKGRSWGGGGVSGVSAGPLVASAGVGPGAEDEGGGACRFHMGSTTTQQPVSNLWVKGRSAKISILKRERIIEKNSYVRCFYESIDDISLVTS